MVSPELSDQNWTAYKGIVTKCLAGATRANTTFEIIEVTHKPGRLPVVHVTGMYGFNFYLKGAYTKPVGGTVTVRKALPGTLVGR